LKVANAGQSVYGTSSLQFACSLHIRPARATIERNDANATDSPVVPLADIGAQGADIFPLVNSSFDFGFFDILTPAPEQILPALDPVMTVEAPRTDPEQQTNTQEDGSRSNVNDLEALLGSHSTSFDQYIGRLPHADISYLASKGVFELPPKLVQDELLDAYFLYIHPFLPVLNEEKLRNDYTSGLQATGLLLYRAIMFAATSVREQSLQSQIQLTKCISTLNNPV
jgi:hypothetical protein